MELGPWGNKLIWLCFVLMSLMFLVSVTCWSVGFLCINSCFACGLSPLLFLHHTHRWTFSRTFPCKRHDTPKALRRKVDRRIWQIEVISIFHKVHNAPRCCQCHKIASWCTLGVHTTLHCDASVVLLLEKNSGCVATRLVCHGLKQNLKYGEFSSGLLLILLDMASAGKTQNSKAKTQKTFFIQKVKSTKRNKLSPQMKSGFQPKPIFWLSTYKEKSRQINICWGNKKLRLSDVLGNLCEIFSTFGLFIRILFQAKEYRS